MSGPHSPEDHYARAKKNTFHASVRKTALPEVHGYDFDDGVDFEKIISSFATTGYQASHLAQAIAIINAMRKEEDITIYLGYTSNMVSSGLRDVFRYLVKHKMVDIVVTTGGGAEEDIIKCIAPFSLGSFEADGAALREDGMNRIGNVLVPNDHYAKFEEFLTPLLADIAEEEKRTGIAVTPSELIDRMGARIDDPTSIAYWAHKNSIPIFCPAIVDGSIGDQVFFFRHKHPKFQIDTARDIERLNLRTMDAKKTGLIILGAGIVKHHILNANMMRNGCDYAVYINTSQEFDGSDAGARPDEAVSWGKILPEARSVKVFGDATILFPLIVASTFAKR
jgi:deoxyhypusine synthase